MRWSFRKPKSSVITMPIKPGDAATEIRFVLDDGTTAAIVRLQCLTMDMGYGATAQFADLSHFMNRHITLYPPSERRTEQ